MNYNDFPPLPPPSGDICPDCDAKINLKSEFCAHCGARIWKTQQTSRKSGFLKTCGLLFLLFVSVLAGAIGACSLTIAETMRTSSRRSELFRASDLKMYWSIGIGALTIAVGLFILAISLNRKSK